MSLDGIPLHRIERSTLRKRIIAVPQDAVFLPDGSTINANLDPLSSATDEECLSVLEKVQLSSFVAERGGLEGVMTADSLSAGQKQLFSLGRAILRRRVRSRALSVGEKSHGGILLLDEVSSSVDFATDRLMQGIIREEFAEYSIIMVSHRLDMAVGFFDRVVVMDRGMVVEEGAPIELREKEGGRFAELWGFGKHGT
jgi:ATP-binding cassette, subfamily C (CFTR/MRP), member 1